MGGHMNGWTDRRTEHKDWMGGQIDRQKAERQILDGKIDGETESREIIVRTERERESCCVSNVNNPWLLILILVLCKNPALPD